MKSVNLRTVALIVFTIAALVSIGMLLPAVEAQGNAEVSRTRNIQYHQLDPNNADTTQIRNLQALPLQSSDAIITRYGNLQVFSLDPNNVDVTQYRNLQYLALQPTNADITRYRNLQYLVLEPNNAHVTRYRNLQPLPMDETLLAANITSLTPEDGNGNPRSNFLRDEIAQFDVAIRNTGIYPLTGCLVSVMVFDPTDNSVLLAYTFVDIAPEQTEQVVLGYRIQSDAQLGTYTVKASIFTNWPSQNGLFLEAETTTFTIS